MVRPRPRCCVDEKQSVETLFEYDWNKGILVLCVIG